MAFVFQRFANGANAAIHHVRGRHHVGSGAGVRNGLLDQRFYRQVIDHVAGVINQPVLAVGGVRVQRHVGDHAQPGKLLLEGGDGGLHQAFGVPCGARIFALGVLRNHREQCDGGNAQLGGPGRCRHQQVCGHPLHAGHAIDGFGAVLAFQHEYRPDQVIGSQRVLAHQAAGKIVGAGAPHPGKRKTHGYSLVRKTGGRF